MTSQPLARSFSSWLAVQSLYSSLEFLVLFPFSARFSGLSIVNISHSTSIPLSVSSDQWLHRDIDIRFVTSRWFISLFGFAHQMISPPIKTSSQGVFSRVPQQPTSRISCCDWRYVRDDLSRKLSGFRCLFSSFTQELMRSSFSRVFGHRLSS